MKQRGDRRYRVVRAGRAVDGVAHPEPMVKLPVEDVLADAELLALPTVRRAATSGHRQAPTILVPLSEWDAAFSRRR